MSEISGSLKPPEKIRVRVTSVLVVALFLWVIGSTAYLLIDSAGLDATPTVYHHPDGTFSLNRRDGPSITPEDVYVCLKDYAQFGRVRLVSNQLTRLVDWGPIIDKGADSGAARYQIEAGGMSFAFMLPGAGYADDSFNPFATIINLRDMDKPPLDLSSGSDVVILADPETTCEEVLNAAFEYSGKGKSLTIIAESDVSETNNSDSMTMLLYHRKNEDSKSSGTFERRRSDFWNTHVQPVIRRLKSVF